MLLTHLCKTLINSKSHKSKCRKNFVQVLRLGRRPDEVFMHCCFASIRQHKDIIFFVFSNVIFCPKIPIS